MGLGRRQRMSTGESGAAARGGEVGRKGDEGGGHWDGEGEEEEEEEMGLICAIKRKSLGERAGEVEGTEPSISILPRRRGLDIMHCFF